MIKPIHIKNILNIGFYMDYTGAERLKNALEKLEKYVSSGGSIAGNSSDDNELLEILQTENDELRANQKQLSVQVEGLITTVEKALEEESAA